MPSSKLRSNWLRNTVFGPRVSSAPVTRKAHLHLEGLEDRLVLDGQSLLFPDPNTIPTEKLSLLEETNSNASAQIQVPAAFSQSLLQDSFNINDFNVTLPAALDANRLFDMNGLRFYGGANKVIQQNTATFGTPDTPTWVMIGTITPTFTPMLLTYGVTTLSYGTNFNDFIRWSSGLYSVANKLAIKTDPNSLAAVLGGMPIQPGEGGLFASSLLNPGVNYTIDSITNGVVKTQQKNIFTVGQQIQFDGLTNANDIANGSGYYVDKIIDVTTFSIKANNNTDLSQASATGGTVTATPGPSDDGQNWGALLPTAQQIQLIDKNQRATHDVFLGFTPTRILLTKTTDAVSQPLLQFAGVQTLGYKGGHLQAGVGFQSTGNQYYLQIDYSGYYQIVNATDPGDNKFVATIAVGQNALTPSISISGILNGSVTATAHGLVTDDWVHFTQLVMPPPADGSPDPLEIGTSYKVLVTGPNSFQLRDPITNQLLTDPKYTATSATAIKELTITNIEPQEVEWADGTISTHLVVTTNETHSLTVGDPIDFKDLQLSSGSIQPGRYYVTSVIRDAITGQFIKFTFGDSEGNDYNPIDPPVLVNGRVTVPLYKAGGLFLGGMATLKLSFDGGYQNGNWVKPTDFEVELSGSVSLFKDFGNGFKMGGVVALKGDNDTSEGLILESTNGQFSVPAWGVSITGNITKDDPATRQQTYNVALVGVSASMIRDETGRETFVVNGVGRIMVNAWRWSGTVVLGHAQTNGLTIIHEADGTTWVKDASLTVVVDSLKPPTEEQQSHFIGKVSVMGGSFDISWASTGPNAQDFEFGIGGSLSLAIGDPTPDANGNWQPTTTTISVNVSPDLVKIKSDGIHFTGTGSISFQVNGAIDIKKGSKTFTIIARDLAMTYTFADPILGTDSSVVLSGGIIFPALANAALELGVDGGSGGLYIDTTTGKWKLNNWRIAIPVLPLPVGPFKIENFILGFTGTGDHTNPDESTDIVIQAGGQIKLFSKGGLVLGVNITLEIDGGKFKIDAIGATIRNLNPGIPIPGLEGAFLTDIAFQLDGIPGSISADVLFGAVMGDKVQVGSKEYAMFQAIISGAYSNSDIKVTGEILIGGGVIGDVTGTLDLDWGKGTYTIDFAGKLFHDIFDVNSYIYFSKDIDAGMFSGNLQVPDDIPIIGGLHVLGSDVMYYVDHTEGGQKFLAGWFEFGGHWKYGLKADYTKGGKITGIGTSAINGLIKELPSGTGSQPNKYNIEYIPSDATKSTAAAGLLGDSVSTTSYGLIEVTWNSPDSQDEIAIAADEGDAVVVWGPGAKVNAHGWVEDTTNGISYMIVADHSRPGDVIIHVAPTAAFTAPGASYDAPDLYVPLPDQHLNVVLQSNKTQNINPQVDWHASFAAPAPEIQNLTVTQPQSTDALNNSAGPDPVTANNATVSFQWRGLDPTTTEVTLFFDFNSGGYRGSVLKTLNGSNLTLSDPDEDGWRTVTVPWDLGDLKPGVPIYVYSVIKDDVHAPVKSDYAGQVQSVPAAQIQVVYSNDTNVTANELQGLPLTVTPVKGFDVQAIANGVVSVASATGLNVGDSFMFSSLTTATGVINGMQYFITSIGAASFQFSNVPGGLANTKATAGTGTAYVDQGASGFYATDRKGLVSPHVDVFQTYRFTMPPTRGVFLAQPSTGQELSSTNELIQYNTFEGHNQLLRMQFEFKVQTAIAGTIYNDFEYNARLDSNDVGLAGVTVYLDDNNNNILDAGEQSVVTGKDGNYLFNHEWKTTDSPTTTYTTWVKVLPPAGYLVTSSPSTSITFSNDGNPQESLNYYNFLIASPIKLGGIVYADTNKNGVRDPGEKGLAGVPVVITPPSGSVIQAITDATGAWTATAYVRGNYQIDVGSPSGGTITTPTTAITLDSSSNLTLNSPFDYTNHYTNSTTVSVWDPVSQQYHPWLLSMIASTVGFGEPAVNFVDLSSGTSGSANVLNTGWLTGVPTTFDVILGKWSTNGLATPLLGYLWGNTGVVTATPANSIHGILYPSLGNDNAYERFALSYDPASPDYSTLASIDATGKAILWAFDPTKFGSIAYSNDATQPFVPYEPYLTPGQTLFQLSGGTPIKLTGFNMASTDHFKSRDLAVGYLSETYNVPRVAVWNHATNTLQSFDVGGRTFVDMISDDFNADGREDIAVLTMDISNQNYYLTILLTQSNGSMKVLRHNGADLAVASDGSPLTNLSSIRVYGGQQAILWNTKDGDSYINAALVTGEQIRITTEKTAFAGNIVALSAGDVDTPARFAVYAPGQTSGHVIGTFTGSITVNTDGKFAVDSELTKYGGTFSGFDVGVTGVTPTATSTTSGIVFNDANSNGLQDAGETGLPGITLQLITPGGGILTTTTSDGSNGSAVGSYHFDNVSPNAYIQIALPSGTWLAQNPPQGIDTNSNGTDGLQVGVTFIGGTILKTVPFDAPTDNPASISIKSADLQNKGLDSLIIRTADSLYIQYFGNDGSTTFTRYDVSSPAGYFKPELELADLNGDGRLDIVTSGQSGVDVFMNIAFGQFKPYLGVLADRLNSKPNGSYSIKGVFSGDLDSGVTSAKTYTHALNFNGSATTVNGVLFAAAGTGGSNYSLQAINPATQETGTLGQVQNFANNLTGAMNTLASDFFYSYGASHGGERLTLTGLTAGVTYTTTFYAVGYGTGQRQEIVFDSLGGSVQLDEDSTGNGNGFMFSRTFTATSDSITFTFVANDTGNSFHQYALTNEIAAVGYTTATPLTGDSGTTIDSGHRYTHALDFAGNQNVNVNGVTFTQAAPQGVNYSLVAYDPVNQTTGGGVYTFDGYTNTLTGAMNSATSNFYYSPTSSSQLTLTGLLVGATYTTTFYGVGFGSGVSRISTITDSLGGSVVIDENAFGDHQGFQFSRTFVATGDSITYTFVAADPAYGFHHYALTNQLVDNQSNYSFERLTGDAGSEVMASKTYTHAIDFNGTGNVVVNGVSLNQTADSAASYSLTAINPVTLTESPMLAVSGHSNNLVGQFNSAASNYFTSLTGSSKLTLNGLTPGITYTATFYLVGDGTAGERRQSIADSLGGSYYVDQNFEGNGNGIRITRTYVASSTTMAFWFMGDDASAPLNFYAMTNEIVTPQPGSPNVYSTEIAILPGGAFGAPDRILAVQQNTGIIYEIGLNDKAVPAATGNVFATDHRIMKMEVGDVSAAGSNDLVIYETRNSDPSVPFNNPQSVGMQQVWMLSATSNYADGSLVMDLGSFTYQPRVDLAIAPLFVGSESILFLGNRTDSQTADILMYRPGNGVQKTSKPGFVGYGLNVGNFISNSSVPNVVIAGENAILVLVPGNDTNDIDNPTGFDPNMPLVEAGTTLTGSSNAAAIGVQAGAHHDELMVVEYVESTGYVVRPFYNTTDSYQVGSNAGGALFDFAVVVPGSGGGVIGGNVFYDLTGNGAWDSTDYGIYDGITLYLDLNNNGKLDAKEQSTTPDRDGNYRFIHLLPKVYTVGIQYGAGYTLTSAASRQAVVASLPHAATYGIDFGVQAKNFGVDFNNDHQADLLLTDPSDQGVYVQLRDGLNRLATHKMGQLPSAEWAVVGVYDLANNGTQDVLLLNSRTGQLQAWDVFNGPGIPVVARKHTLNYTVPSGFTIAGVGDLDHDGMPELIIEQKLTGEHRVVELESNSPTESPLRMAKDTIVVGVGDLDGDGNTDLLLENWRTDILFARLYKNGNKVVERKIGKVDTGWSVAGVVDLVKDDTAEILFQDRNTGKGYAWMLAPDLTVKGSSEIDIGTHIGLRLQLADQQTLHTSDLKISGITSSTTVVYKENAAPVIVGSAGRVTQIHARNFEAGSLTVWLNSNGTVDDRLSIKHAGDSWGKIGVEYDTQTIRYSGFEIATYSGGLGTIPLTITFNSTANKAAVQATLKAITFENVSDNPSIATRTVQFVISDGDGGVSNTVSCIVKVIPSNDKPVITTSRSFVQYTEGNTPVIIDNAIILSDVDSANLAGGVLTAKIVLGSQSTDRLGIQASGPISLNQSTRQVSYNGQVIGIYSGTNVLTIKFNSNATPAQVQELARHIVFSSTSNAPKTTPRQISFTLSDGDGGTSIAALGDFVTITPSNDAPVLTLNNTTPVKYTENAFPVLISSGATVIDADLLDFNTGTLTVSITGDGSVSDSLRVKNFGIRANQISVRGNSIRFTSSLWRTYEVATFTGGTNTSSLVITFNSSARKTEVQAVMRSITFANNSDNPSSALRKVSFTLTDGDGGVSNTVYRTVKIAPINDKPVIANLGQPVTFQFGGSPVLLSTMVTVTDDASVNFNGGKLAVFLAMNKQSVDRIEIQEGNGITTSGNTIAYNGYVIGSYSNGTTFTARFNTFASPDAVQALLRQITFRTTSQSSHPRTVNVALTDGDGGSSMLVSKLIRLSDGGA